MGQTVKTDRPALREEIERLLRAHLPVRRDVLAAKYKVSEHVVRTMALEARTRIADQPAPPRPVAGRTVMEFDGPRMFEIRRARWLTQDQLARLAIDPTDPLPQKGVSRGEIGHLERTPTGPRSADEHRKPTLITMLKLAHALGVEPEDLLELPHRLDTPASALIQMRDERARSRQAGQEAGDDALVPGQAALEDTDHEQQAQAG